MATLKNTTISDTGYLRLPVGTTAERPSSPDNGMIRYNVNNSVLEYWNGSDWVSITDTSNFVPAFTKYTYILSSSTASISGIDDNGNVLTYNTTEAQVEVYFNGVKQVAGASNDYTASDGSSISFNFEVPSGSVVEVQVYSLLPISTIQSQWTTSGSDIYYNDGRVLIGSGAPTANLTVQGSSAQSLHLNSSGSNVIIYMKGANGSDHWGLFTGSSGGGLTLKDETNNKDAFNARPGGYMAYPNMPVFMVHGNGGSTAYGSLQPFKLNVVQYDNKGAYNATNGIYTAPVSGIYEFGFNAYTYNSGQWCVLMWNGSSLNPYIAPGGADHTVLCTTVANGVYHMSWKMPLQAGEGAAVAWRAGYTGNLYQSHAQFSGSLISAS